MIGINTNNLLIVEDNTIFSSERVKLIPFNRHFLPSEQETGLKSRFRQDYNKSGILNWLIEGYRLLMSEGLATPEKVTTAIADYQRVSDIFGDFCAEYLIPSEGNKLKTKVLYDKYVLWVKSIGCKPWRVQDFVEELRKKYVVLHNGRLGNYLEGWGLGEWGCHS